MSPHPPPQHLSYREFPPAHTVAEFVATYWEVAVRDDYPPGVEHVIWPDGSVSLSVMVSGGPAGARVVGPRMVGLRLPLFPGIRLWGVRFRPDAGGRILGVPARDLRDRVVDADEVVGSVDDLVAAVRPCRAPQEAAGAFDSWLGTRIPMASAIDPVVRAVVDALVDSNGCAPVARLAEQVGVSIRQLQRRFGDAVGLTPKQFARIRRMRTALAKLLEEPRERWSAIAAELRYADQAHLVRDIAKLTGLTPSIITRRMENIAHLNVRP